MFAESLHIRCVHNTWSKSGMLTSWIPFMCECRVEINPIRAGILGSIEKKLQFRYRKTGWDVVRYSRVYVALCVAKYLRIRGLCRSVFEVTRIRILALRSACCSSSLFVSFFLLWNMLLSLWNTLLSFRPAHPKSLLNILIALVKNLLRNWKNEKQDLLANSNLPCVCRALSVCL